MCNFPVCQTNKFQPDKRRTQSLWLTDSNDLLHTLCKTRPLLLHKCLNLCIKIIITTDIL